MLPPASLVRFGAAYLALLGAAGAWLPYLALVLAHRGWSATGIGAVLSGMAIVRLVAGSTWAAVADARGDAGGVARALAALTAVGAVAVWWVPDGVPLVAALLAVAAVRVPASTLLDVATVRMLVAEGRDPGTYGQVRLWGTLGYLLVASAVAGFVATRPDLALLVAAGCAVVGAALIPRAAASTRAPTAKLGPAMLQVAHDRVLLVTLGGAVLAGAAHNLWDVWFPALLQARGFGAGWTGAGLGVAMAAEIGVFAAGPWLVRRLDPHLVVVIGAAAGLVRFAVTGLAHGVVPVIAVQALHGVSFGAWWVALVEIARRRAPDTIRASVQALVTAAAFGVGPLLAGLVATSVADAVGLPGLFVAAAALSGLGAAVAAAVVPAEAVGLGPTTARRVL